MNEPFVAIRMGSNPGLLVLGPQIPALASAHLASADAETIMVKNAALQEQLKG